MSERNYTAQVLPANSRQNRWNSAIQTAQFLRGTGVAIPQFGDTRLLRDLVAPEYYPDELAERISRRLLGDLALVATYKNQGISLGGQGDIDFTVGEMRGLTAVVPWTLRDRLPFANDRIRREDEKLRRGPTVDYSAYALGFAARMAGNMLGAAARMPVIERNPQGVLPQRQRLVLPIAAATRDFGDAKTLDLIEQKNATLAETVRRFGGHTLLTPVYQDGILQSDDLVSFGFQLDADFPEPVKVFGKDKTLDVQMYRREADQPEPDESRDDLQTLREFFDAVDDD